MYLSGLGFKTIVRHMKYEKSLERCLKVSGRGEVDKQYFSLYHLIGYLKGIDRMGIKSVKLLFELISKSRFRISGGLLCMLFLLVLYMSLIVFHILL